MYKRNKLILFLFLIGVFLFTMGVVAANDGIEDTHDVTSVEKASTSMEKNTFKTETYKNIKKSNNTKINKKSIQDYYVSDSTGSDDNTGTSNKPFKTIQKALDKTENTNTYNIHILDGRYTGEGNTNLTVNGNNYINIIGQSNNTIIDGEAKYDIDNDTFHWSSSAIWAPYVNSSGNWIMNITQGNGLIKLSNLTIQNGWALGIDGGDAIYKYPIANVDNHANLEIDNVYFYKNHGGVGSAVRNNADSTLIVNNSFFEGNRKSGSTGNEGIIFNNGTATILNSLFDKNYARWGVILNDKNITVINCTLSNGVTYDGESTYTYGAGIAFNTGYADYYNVYYMYTNNNIINCTFINNEEMDIRAYCGNLNLTGNKFINSTGIYLSDQEKSVNYSFNIINNTFEGSKNRVHVVTASGEQYVTISSYVEDHEVILSGNKIHIKNGTAITVYGGKVVNNEIISDKATNIDLFGNNITVTNNYIITNSTYAVTLGNSRRYNNISDNFLVSQIGHGDYAVNGNSRRNTIVNNTPEILNSSVYVSPDVTVATDGSISNPTTLKDALTKIQENASIILLPGNDGNYRLNQKIIINQDTLKSDVKKFTISGLAYYPTINGLNKTNIFDIEEGYNIELNNMTFTGGNNTYGGLINVKGNLTVVNCEFKDSFAEKGGAIYSSGSGNIKLDNNRFNNINSNDETLYLTNTGNKLLTNNQYIDTSIKTSNIIIKRENTNPVMVGDDVKILINPIILTNPAFYDNDITSNIIYKIYENGINTQNTTSNEYNIDTSKPVTIVTNVKPDIFKEYSNELAIPVLYHNLINVNMITEDILMLGNNTITTYVVDEFSAPVNNASVYYYINDELVATSEVINSVATANIPKYPQGEYTLTQTFNDTNNKYYNQTKTNKIIITDKIYVSPSASKENFGTKDKPTTINDALKRIYDNNTIYFLPGEYRLDQAITINDTTTPHSKKFIMTGEDVILNGREKTNILHLSKGYNLTLNGMTITHASVEYYGTDGRTNENSNVLDNYGNLTLNNTKFINNHGNAIESIRSYTDSTLIIDESNIFKNIENTKEEKHPFSYAIWIDYATLIINKNNVFENCNSTFRISYSNITINENNTFKNNIMLGTGALYVSQSNLVINGQNYFMNNSGTGIGANRGAAIRIVGGTATIRNSMFINNTHANEGAAIVATGASNLIIENNTFINNTSPKETITLYNIRTKQISNNTYINSSILMNMSISLEPYTTPLRLGDTITVNIEEIKLINPSYYDSDLLDKMNIYIYANEPVVKITKDTTQENIILNTPDEVTIFTKTDESDVKSNNITFEVLLDNLINTMIIAENQIGIYNESLKFEIQVTDKQNNPVDDGAIVTLYNNIGDIIAQNTTLNGKVTLITTPLTDILSDYVITYNTTEKYNNKTRIISITALQRDVYVSPDVSTPQDGTIDKATTLQDAISKVANKGTIHLLYGNNGTYTPTSKIIISDLTTNKNVNTFNINSHDKIVTIDAKNIESLINIASRYVITFNNVSIINAPNVAIYNNGTIRLNGEALYKNNNAVQKGGLIYNNRGTVYITGKNEFRNNGADKGGVIYSYSGRLTIDGENNFHDNLVTNIGGAIVSEASTLTINGHNIFKNNKINYNDGFVASGGAIFVYGFNSNMNINGSNIFEENKIHARQQLYGGALSIGSSNYMTTGTFIINGSNIFKNNTIDYGGVGVSQVYGGAIHSDLSGGSLTIAGSNIFEGNEVHGFGGALSFIGSNLNITGNNQFINNKNINRTIFEMIEYRGVISIIPRSSAVINIEGTNIINNTADLTGILTFTIATDSVKITVNNNTFLGNNGNISIIYFNNTNTQNIDVTINNNNFINNTANNETIYFVNDISKLLTNNTYYNTPIGMKELQLTSILENQEIEAETEIPLNISLELINPTFYDTDIVEKINYEIFINNKNILNTTNKDTNIQAEYYKETDGIINIYTKITDKTSNNITIKVLKPKKTETTISTENPIIGELTNITATFYDENKNPVNGGKAIFKVNGKTLRDDEGNVIYVDVIDGQAVLPDVKITHEWMKPDTTIQAFYSGTDEFESIITEKTSIQVTKPEANIELVAPEGASAGETITLTAKVTSGSTNLNSGRVVFKLNGKTLKDESGNALYVNVENGIATTTYTIPLKTKAKTYTLSAVYTSNDYQRAQGEADIVIAKA